MLIDCHCHTDCSDGHVTIEERIAIIKSCGYDAATITDHDFISPEQVNRAQTACGDMPYVPGIELSLRHEGHVVHVLGYFIDAANSMLSKHIQKVQDVDYECTHQMLQYFRPYGITIDMEDLETDSLHTFYSIRFVNHVAANLFSNNYQRCLAAFLEAWKSMDMTYADFAPWDVRSGIELIHQAGGIAVLAHPGGENDASMEPLGFLLHSLDHLKAYKGWGLDGLEAVTPAHTAAETDYYTQCATELGLFITAGSDCHGDDPFTGPGRMGRSIEIPAQSYEQLLEAYHVNRRLNPV